MADIVQSMHLLQAGREPKANTKSSMNFNTAKILSNLVSAFQGGGKYIRNFVRWLTGMFNNSFDPLTNEGRTAAEFKKYEFGEGEKPFNFKMEGKAPFLNFPKGQGLEPNIVPINPGTHNTLSVAETAAVPIAVLPKVEAAGGSASMTYFNYPYSDYTKRYNSFPLF